MILLVENCEWDGSGKTVGITRITEPFRHTKTSTFIGNYRCFKKCLHIFVCVSFNEKMSLILRPVAVEPIKDVALWQLFCTISK